MPQFDITFYYSQIFWLALIFGLLYFVIKLFVIPTVEGILHNRSNTKETNLDSASSLSKQIKELEEVYNVTYKQILGAAHEIKRETLKKLTLKFEAKKKALNAELDKVHNNVNAEVAHTIGEFRLNKESYCIGSAGFIIKKITDKSVDQTLLNECYKRLESEIK